MKQIFFFIVSIIFLVIFFFINLDINYNKHREIKFNVVIHPEFTSKKEVAKITSVGFKNLRADLYRLETIQYIGSNALKSEYKKYLYKMLDLITELNPYFEHPYKIGQLHLPDYNDRYEKLTKEQQQINIGEGIKIGLKGIKNFCKKDILEKIKKEDNIVKIINDDKYKNPCKTYVIPYHLAYIYSHYNKDNLNASYYYKVVSANDDSPAGAKMLASIFMGKGGQREKSIFMFLQIGSDIDKDKICKKYIGGLNELTKGIFSRKIGLNGKIIKDIDDKRKLMLNLKKTNEEQIDNILRSTTCVNYANKAVRELNMLYLDLANEAQLKKEGTRSYSPEALKKKGYINYIPLDFQRYEEKGQGILYYYNMDTGYFDTEMGKIKN